MTSPEQAPESKLEQDITNLRDRSERYLRYGIGNISTAMGVFVGSTIGIVGCKKLDIAEPGQLADIYRGASMATLAGVSVGIVQTIKCVTIEHRANKLSSYQPAAPTTLEVTPVTE